MEKFRRYDNVEGINKTTFEKRVIVFCPLGNNYTAMTVSCEMELDKYFCDMLDVDNFFVKQLGGAKLTQEGLTQAVFDVFIRNYEPKHLKVQVFGNGHIDAFTVKEI